MALQQTWPSFDGQGVLITGGTKGIGLAIGLAFARRGASVALTQKWGSADPDAVLAAFSAADARAPIIIDADVAHDEDAAQAAAIMRDRVGRLDVLVSNVAFAPVVKDVDDYTRRGLVTAIEHSTWPIVSFTRAAKDAFGRYPRHVIGISSEGADAYHVNYDIVAASKAALEALCRYLHQRLRPHGSNVNVVRTRFVSTDSLRATFGDGFEPFVETRAPGLFCDPGEIAEAIVGLCSGFMDAVGGQVVTVDRGASNFDNFSRLFAERATDRQSPAALET